MTWFTWLTDHWRQASQVQTYGRIPADRTDAQLYPEVLTAREHYYRVILAQMHITRSVDYGQRRFPAVHSLVQARFGDGNVEIPNIADTSRVAASERSDIQAIIARNFHLTPLLPFNGGQVMIDAGLIELMGENYLNSFMQTLGSFASLLSVPQLSTALQVAGPLASGIQQLITMDKNTVKLAYRDTFNGGDIQDGYLVAIAKPGVPLDQLWVVNNQLMVGRGMGPGECQPFTEAEFMLLRFQVLASRDDWEGLTGINQPFQKALEHLIYGRSDEAEAELRRARVAVQQAPELTHAHRRIVEDQLKRRYKEAKDDASSFGAAGQAALPSLADVMLVPTMSIAEAVGLPPLTLAEAMAPLA